MLTCTCATRVAHNTQHFLAKHNTMQNNTHNTIAQLNAATHTHYTVQQCCSEVQQMQQQQHNALCNSKHFNLQQCVQVAHNIYTNVQNNCYNIQLSCTYEVKVNALFSAAQQTVQFTLTSCSAAGTHYIDTAQHCSKQCSMHLLQQIAQALQCDID